MAPDLRVGRLRDLVSSLQFRLVTGFALTMSLTLAAAGIFISLATETQVERFESDQATAQAGRVIEFISNNSVEDRDPPEAVTICNLWSGRPPTSPGFA